MEYLLKMKYADHEVEEAINTSYQFSKQTDEDATKHADYLVGSMLSSKYVFLGAELSRRYNPCICKYLA